MSHTPDSRYHTKNRIVAVDIVRIMAAMAVMYEHMPWFGDEGYMTKTIASGIPVIFSALSPLFFVLAGYFACRNISWKKALDNSWWSLAPFFLWNTIFLLFICCINHIVPTFPELITKYGFQSIFVEGWKIFPDLPDVIPLANRPLWFMRDLIFLFLLSPILVKYAKIVFPVCIILSLLPVSCQYFNGLPYTVLMPRSIAFFAGGCLLQTFSKDFQKKALSFYSPLMIIIYVSVMSADALYFHFLTQHPQLSFCKSILGIWVFYQTARWIEVKIPCATDFALKFAPVTFLTFAGHILLGGILNGIMRITLPDMCKSDIVLLYPPVIFLAMAAFFFVLKHWCPALLHLVAHYKLRPDDLKPADK